MVLLILNAQNDQSVNRVNHEHHVFCGNIYFTKIVFQNNNMFMYMYTYVYIFLKKHLQQKQQVAVYAKLYKFLIPPIKIGHFPQNDKNNIKWQTTSYCITFKKAC